MSQYLEDQERYTSPFTMKVVALSFLAFLFLFYEVKPFETKVHSSSSLGQIFSLYFWIFNQTLGMVHEAGHGVCYILHCPKFITALNGTLFQVLFPLGIAWYYKYKKNKIAYFIGLFFVGFSLQYVAWYMTSADTTVIIKASESFLGVDAYHDFHYLFKTLGVLEWNHFISGSVKFFAYVMMIYTTVRMLFMAFITK